MVWKKGQSGNPSGRPKEYRKVVEAARKKTMFALGVLEDIAKNGENEGARRAAAAEILDRGWGKSPQYINIDPEGEGMAEPSEMTDEELAAIAAGGKGET